MPTAPLSFSPSWRRAFAVELRRRVEAAPGHRITLDTAALAARWGLKPGQIEALTCESARLAGLTTGIVDATAIDVMTVEAALALIDGGVEADTISGYDDVPEV